MSASERFWSKVNKTDGCWEWTAGKQYGYGIFSVGRKNYKAHRWAYEELHGAIPSATPLDHLCRNRACVRPDHLEPVTHAVNNARTVGFRTRKTHCPNGHAYEEHGRMQSGYPACRVCDTARHKERRQRNAQ